MGWPGPIRQCQHWQRRRARTAGTWRAYLSTQGAGAVNARDRIGKGPWRNAKGTVIAQNVDDLHSAKANLTKETLLTEKGQPVNGRGDTPNQHDVLTGSQMNGTAYTDDMDHTCNNWTSSSTGGAQVGHSDRMGLADTEEAKSWNSSHPSKGCSQENWWDRRSRVTSIASPRINPGDHLSRRRPRHTEAPRHCLTASVLGVLIVINTGEPGFALLRTVLDHVIARGRATKR